MGKTFEVKKGFFGKWLVFYKCLRCHHELESDLKNAGASETCPICKLTVTVPGRTEWQRIQDAKRHEQLVLQRIKSEKEREAQEQKEMLAKQAEAHTQAAKEKELLREKRFLQDVGLDEKGRAIGGSAPARVKARFLQEIGLDEKGRPLPESKSSSQKSEQKGFLSYEGTGSLVSIGGLLLAGGLACAAYFFFAFKTAVDTDIGKINNLGLLNDRTGGIIIGMGLAVTGAIFIAVCSNRSDK